MAQNKLKITYNGQDIVNADISSATTKTLLTSGKLMEGNVVVEAEGGSSQPVGTDIGLLLPETEFKADFTNAKIGAVKVKEDIENWYGIPLGFTRLNGNYSYEITFMATDNDFVMLTTPGNTLHDCRIAVVNGQIMLVGITTSVQYVGTVSLNQEHTVFVEAHRTGSTATLTYIYVYLDGVRVGGNLSKSTDSGGEYAMCGWAGSNPRTKGKGSYVKSIKVYKSEYDRPRNQLYFEIMPVQLANGRTVLLSYSDSEKYGLLYDLTDSEYFDFIEGDDINIKKISSTGNEQLYGYGLSTYVGTNDNGTLKLPVLTSYNEFRFTGLKKINNYALGYKWRRLTSVPSVYFPDLETLDQYALEYAFSYSTFKTNSEVIMPNVKTIGSYSLSYTLFGATNIDYVEVGNSDTAITIASYGMQYFCSGIILKDGFYVKGLKSATTANCLSYSFQGSSSTGSTNMLNDDAVCEFTDLETINASTAAQYVMRYRLKGSATRTKGQRRWCPFPKLKTVIGTQAFYYGLANCTFNKPSTYPQYADVITFPKLEEVGTNTGNNSFSYAFANSTGQKYIWFPMLRTIGWSATTSYGNFNYAFQGSVNATCPIEVCFPELQTIASTSTSTTASYSTFNYSTMVSKFWFPKLSSISGKPNTQYLFRNSTQSGLEIHFGIENETYIKGLEGFSTKFGATNATIYFDCVNHITVNGVVYNRDGEHYITNACSQSSSSASSITHPDDRYSWKSSGGAVIYTLECWTPAVGDAVYDEDDNQIGTIGGIS